MVGLDVFDLGESLEDKNNVVKKKKNHESVRKVAELTIKHCNHALCLAQVVPS
jgi:hypothetical protein